MKKKILAILLAVMMLVGTMPLSLVQAVDAEYDPDGDGEYFVLQAESTTIKATDTTVDVKLNIVANSGVYGMKYYVIYDPELTLGSNDNVTPGTAFPDFLAGDIGSKDITSEDMSTLDVQDWDWSLENVGWTAGDWKVTTVYSECVDYSDYSTETGWLCTFTFSIDPNSTKDEYTVRVLPVWGNYIREDPNHPLADDWGIVEILDPIGLPGTITVEADKPVNTDPTITVSNAEILAGTEKADFTLNIENNPGIYSLYGYIGYDDAMGLVAFENGEVFADSELFSKGPMNNDAQRDIVIANNKNAQKVYDENGASYEGVLASQVYYEGLDLETNNTSNGVVASFSLSTANLEPGTYDITFYYSKNSTIDVDFESVDFELVHGTLTVLACVHDYVQVGEPVAPTCTAVGYTNYECSKCGETAINVNAGDEVAALGHDYEEVVTAPTCTEDGYTTYDCTRCDSAYVDNFVDALGHDYEEVVTAPTCTEGGYTTCTCSVCGDSYTVDETPAAGHSWTVTSTTGTCGEIGKINSECTVCGETKSEDGALIEHNYEKTASVDPTCTVAGSVTSECTICGAPKTEEVSALGHDYNAVVTAPTCTEGGYTTYTCTRNCGEANAEYVDDYTDALGHDYAEDITLAPTCTEKGNKHFDCTRCDAEYDEDIDALGHDYKAVVTAPTCTDVGYTTYTCSVCGDSYTADEKAALGHDYEAVVTAPTCTEIGYTTYTCSRCGDSYTADEKAALGHAPIDVIFDPTCTEDGYTGHFCERCSEKIADDTDIIPALGHVIVDTVVDPTCDEKGYTEHKCEVCGESTVDTFVDALGHKWDNGVVTKAPTTEAEGEKTYTCEVCEKTKVETIEKLASVAGDKNETTDKEDNKSDDKVGEKADQTGDNMMMFVFVALIAVVSAAGVVLFKKKLFVRK